MKKYLLFYLIFSINFLECCKCGSDIVKKDAVSTDSIEMSDNDISLDFVEDFIQMDILSEKGDDDVNEYTAPFEYKEIDPGNIPEIGSACETIGERRCSGEKDIWETLLPEFYYLVPDYNYIECGEQSGKNIWIKHSCNEFPTVNFKPSENCLAPGKNADNPMICQENEKGVFCCPRFCQNQNSSHEYDLVRLVLCYQKEKGKIYNCGPSNQENIPYNNGVFSCDFANGMISWQYDCPWLCDNCLYSINTYSCPKECEKCKEIDGKIKCVNNNGWACPYP
jgi:hypothetical protein